MNAIQKKFSTFAAAAILCALPFAASAQEACTTYTVKDGDTLGSIAQTAYGTYDYQVIFNANRDALADNPNDLAGGLQLILPCKDGRLTPDTELNAVIQSEETKPAAAPKKNDTYEPPLKFVTGNNWKPFTDESLLGGGIFVRLAQTAMKRGGNDRESTLAYVDDWQSHIDTLLPSGAFDVSIAWESPDCTKMDLLSEESVKRCTDFDYSLPIYEVVYVLYTKADSKYANVKTWADFKGAKICRPDGWGTGDLEVQGLTPPFIEMVRPVDPADCADKLLKGEVDVYTLEVETAAANFDKLGANDKVAQNPYLSNIIAYR
ncbi:MAG: transporter substrate-binding domain-containing protein, partial [Rhodobacteraceae bacterium]|nr:transporter substrate-binding domain-containing protein [Paracoccaceae bacterium]